MFYQWGHKDPFSFTTNSNIGGSGKYPVKIYTIDGVLIYQKEYGVSNKDKQPVGGIIESLISATSMMETIKSPVTSYYGNSAVINQVGHTKDLFDYYWTSYSRGSDGKNGGNKNWHNDYLDAYITQRLKSIYDPCPFGFRISSNGTYNEYVKSPGWTEWSYTGGASLTLENNITWFPAVGWRSKESCVYSTTGKYGLYAFSIPSTQVSVYTLEIISLKLINPYFFTNARSSAYSVRCIEEV